MALKAILSMGLTLIETLSAGVPAASSAKKNITQDQWNINLTLDGNGIPAVSMGVAQEYTMASSAASVDLTTLTGANGATESGSTKKLVALLLKNTGAAVMTIAKGASNGYTGLGSAFSMSIPAGGAVLFYLKSGGVTVDATHKILDVTGTDGQVLQVVPVLG